MHSDPQLFADDQESELGPLSPRSASGAVVYSSDWTTETLLSQLDRGNIIINPRFQRRDAWTISRKSQFIESILLGLPIPQIVLAEVERGRYIILDGKQRLLTLQQFTGRSEGKNNAFSLVNLEVKVDLNRRTYRDLIDDPSLLADRNAFENHVIRTMVIRSWPDSNFLHLVFVRLNTGNVPLSPQELRQALVPGPFVDFVDDRSIASAPLQELLGLDGPDFRMRDAELLARYMAFNFFIEDYRGNLKEFLDQACDRLNKEWPLREQQVIQAFAAFETALSSAENIFGDTVGRKINQAGPERRLNRAVLDVQLYYFSQTAVLTAALQNKESVVQAFRELCLNDIEFRNAIERTTKSLDATRTRFQRWGQALSELLQVTVGIPQLEA